MEQLILSLETPGLFLHKSRGFLEAKKRDHLVSRVSLDDIAAVIVNAHGTSYTNALIVDLAHRGIPLVLCGKNHMPVAWVQPLAPNVRQSKYLQAQSQLSKPRAKSTWKLIVQAKIDWQNFALRQFGRKSNALDYLSKVVKSGDPMNTEAQAARIYWKQLMGSDFTRDVTKPGANQLFNYGYTILRAAMCRAIVSSGLNPSFGIHHSSMTNPFRLVDDLMEPFRPLIDLKVEKLVASGTEGLDGTTKIFLAEVMQERLPGNGGGPLMNHLYRLANSYREVVCGETKSLTIALPKSSNQPLRAKRKEDGQIKRISPDVASRNV